MNICSVTNISESVSLVYTISEKSPEVLRRTAGDMYYRFSFSFLPEITIEIIMLSASTPNMKPIDTGMDISKWNIRASSLTLVNMSISPTPYLTYSNLLRMCSTTKNSCLNPSIANMFDEYTMNGSFDTEKTAGTESTAKLYRKIL